MTEEIKKVNIMWDASQLDMFQLCPFRFFVRYVLNKAQSGKAKQLDRGTIIHSGYEVYYKALKDHQKAREAVQLAVEKIKIDGTNSDLEPSEVSYIAQVAKENLEYWEFEDQQFEILAVEEPFIYLLYEDEYMKIYMTGKIDLLVNWHDRQTYYERLPIDHKSYDRKFPLKRMINQFQNYAYAAQSNYLRVNRIGMQTSLSAEEKHIRPMLSYDPLILEDWKNNVVLVAQQYIECVATGKWMMNLTSCDKFNRLCEYYEICDSSGQEAKIHKLNYLVDAEVWDVTKGLK